MSDENDFNLDDVDEADLEGIDLSDPEAIAAFLEGREQPVYDDDADNDAGEDEQDEVDGDTSGQEAPDSKKETEQEPAQEPEPEKKEDDVAAEETTDEPYVETEDGKHRIPFSVLKGMREENRDLKRRYSELQEAAEKSKKLEAFLEAKGIDFEDPDTLSEKDLQELAELDPTVGKMGNALKRLLEARAPDVQEVEPEPVDTNPVEQAIQENDTLVAWRADPGRWKEVQDIDQLLLDTGKWEGKPLSERFAEVVRISKLMNGEPVDTAPSPEKTKQVEQEKPADVAAKKVAAASEAKPTSLSHLGKSPTTEKTMVEKLSEMSPDQLQEAMMDMSEHELEQAYAALGM